MVTGGGQGITATAVMALAKKTRPKLVILGRSPEPEPLPDWLKDHQDEAGAKKAIIRHMFNNQPQKPADVEQAYRRLAAGGRSSATWRSLSKSAKR